MKTTKITEGDIELIIPDPKKYPLDAKSPAFYNPEMKLNRDISVLLLQALDFKDSVLDMLTATGIRGLRIKKALPKTEVTLNDNNKSAIEIIKKNTKLNKLKVNILNQDAQFKFPKVYRYVDVDPFGTPIPFLDVAIKALKNKGILAVTATDTSALCGSYPKSCMRKYQSVPMRNELMHEVGLRILIKKVQEVAAQYEQALTPIFSHSTRHYMRVYFKSEPGAVKTNNILKKIGYISHCSKCGYFSTHIDEHCDNCNADNDVAGPLWLGPLWDKSLLKKMHLQIYENAKKAKAKTTSFKHTPANELLTSIYRGEAQINQIGFFDLHKLASRLKLKEIPRTKEVTYKLEAKGYKVSRTHFTDKAIKTNAPHKEVIKILKR
jgi:tRNA (guanine26-N2/guanine27-N2)-dimethyltransferase